MSMAGRCVLFDCDGVLADTEGATATAMTDALRDIGVVLGVETVRAEFVGKTWAEVSKQVRQRWAIAIDRPFWSAYRERQIALLRDSIRPDAGCLAMLDELASFGWRLAVLSDSAAAKVRLVLELGGIADRFGPHVYCADMLGANKAEPSAFRNIAKTLTADPAACVLVDDRDLPLESALTAGLAAIKFVGFAAAPSREHDARIAVADSYERLMTLLSRVRPIAPAA